MKRIITLFAIAAISLTAFAQKENSPSPNHKKHLERFQAEKVAFLTQKMDLTVTEAEAFWPIYNEDSKATETVHREMMAAVDKLTRAPRYPMPKLGRRSTHCWRPKRKKPS